MVHLAMLLTENQAVDGGMHVMPWRTTSWSFQQTEGAGTVGDKVC